MSLILFFAVGTFSIGSWVDPIEGSEWLTYEVMDGVNRLGLHCQPSTSYYEVRVYPEGYAGRSGDLRATSPNATSRFSKAPKPLDAGWFFDPNHLTFSSSGELKTKARFVDELAKDTSFSIRFWNGSPPVRTITIEYVLDQVELRSFMAQCGPKKVNRFLTEWGSPAAPQPQ